MSLDDRQLLRWSRQLMLPELDVAGQERLRAATALVVGLGGLGCPAALYLAAAGIGRLLLADGDVVELSNLQRQVLHTEASLGMAKTASAMRSLQAIAPDTRCEALPRLEGAALDAAVARADVVVDGTDNIAARLAMNAASLRHRVPLVSAAAIRWEAQLSTFDPRREDSPCYRCLFPGDGTDEDLNCAENGVAAPLVGTIGTLEAMEALKLVTGVGEPLVGRLLVHDARELSFDTLRLPRNPACPACGSG